MIEDAPLIAGSQDLTVTDIRRASVFMENSDPRNLAPGEVSAFADSIGLLKELEYSQGGSGFSFNYIGADRTGVRLAELATASPASASAVQSLFAEDFSEGLFMAEFRDLPEFMAEDVFISRYGGVGQPRYNAVIEDIENRIASMRLFRELD